jgi:O-antigen/teichoic acid export membrane protein
LSEQPIDAQHEMKRGLWWMGTATAAMRVLDVGGTFIVLQFLSRAEVGVATLAWSIATFLEAFNGLGVGTVVARRRDLSHSELSGLYWFATLLGVAATLLVAIASPWLAALKGQPTLGPMILVSSSKLIFVGASLVPLQILTRDLRYRESGAAQTLATLGEAITKVTLIALGFGAWGLVVANAARGLFLFLALLWLAPFRPQLTLAVRSTIESVRFGLKVATSSIIYNVYRNADFLLIGLVLGNEALGVYRVAFDLGMAPLEIVLNLVNRVQFPIYARLQGQGERLRDAFVTSARSLVMVVGPVAALLTFASADLLHLFAGGRWLAAVPLVQILCWASLLRGMALLFPQLYHATGRPEFAVYDALVIGVTLVGGFGLALTLAPAATAPTWVAWTWLLSYPIALAYHFHLANQCAPITPAGLLGPLVRPGLGILAMCLVLALGTLLRDAIGSPLLSLLFLVALGLGAYSLYLHRVMHLRAADLLPQRAST